jgi:beta-xylosidase
VNVRRWAIAASAPAVVLASMVRPGFSSGAATPLHTQREVTGAAFTGDFPDPSVVVADGRYVAYSTQSRGENIQMISSTDLLHWSRRRDALPVLPGWAEVGYTWAPAVVADPSGGYEMFFAARDSQLDLQCIGRATSPSPFGPFVDPGPQPFLCQRSLGGSIDPYVFTGDGTSYLIWKSDGENGTPQQVWSEALNAPNTGLVGTATLLLSATSTWEDGVVEGPAMLRTGTGLFLYFSGNRWSSSAYSIGAVGCDTPLGPCVNTPTGQAVSSLSDLSGPGGPTFFVAPGGMTMMAFAAWTGLPGSTTGKRDLYIDDVDTTGTSPTLTNILVPRRTSTKPAHRPGRRPAADN